MKTLLKTLFLSVALFLSGCAAVDPGEDPLVVNTERAETIAKGTFDLVMQVDASQHEFWRTNQPAFHNFVQWLREPQTVESNTLPRCAAFILTVDNVKLAYKAGRASSNDLVTAGLTLNAAAIQAGSWLNLVTNKPPL
jgi:hypothetical protein